MENLQMITDVPSSSSSTDCPEKYDIFLSFRGEDTRNNFTSHLYGSLEQKNVKTFIDYELEKGDEISPALMKAIEESHASIIIFSENYASSKWCLEELSKIMECKKSMGQDVIPVFYKVEPTHVRKHIGSYEQAFMKHEQDMRHNMKKVQKWRVALTEAANLAGFTWDSQSDRSELEFIKDIVGDVTKKLNLRYPIELKGLVGIEENYIEIEALLKIRSSEVRLIGIWGMGGIGKSTLATALYAKLSSSFESACFLENVRGKSEIKGPNALREKLISMLLKGENLSGNFDTTRLRRRKVFIVLDDVATHKQLDEIIDCSWLGSGSRVIVTTRNKHMFRDNHEIYEVKKLNHDHSLELFCANVFSAKYPKIGYEELVEGVIGYCKGVPLALKVLGALFCGTSKEVWESELRKLKKYPNEEIQNVLRLNYDSLDRAQKDIFLDIACFLKGEPRDYVTSLLEACGFFPIGGIQVLLDMALITISVYDTIEMHDLIQEMGREIVQKSTNDLGRRSRLWKHEEAYDVLKDNKGTEVVEGIMLHLSQTDGALHLSSNSFTKMCNLRILKITYENHVKNGYVYLPYGLQSLPNKLRCLHWSWYCLESLPSSFCPKMLVELCMPNSNLEKLWDGIQNLENLKTINLEGSKQLVEVPDLSMAPNLDEVTLNNCLSLCEVHPSIFSLPNLRSLDLCCCIQIESLTTNIHMKSLQRLCLSNCSSLKEFSVTSEEMDCLYLSGTAIHDLPSSIFRNKKLKHFDLRDCVNLKVVGNKLFDDLVLGSLTTLNLSRCKELDASNLGHILDWVPSLITLDLVDCYNLEVLPDNIGLLSSLNFLNLSNCCNLEALPGNIGLLSSLKSLNLSNCSNIEALTGNIELLSSLKSLNLSNCRNLKALPGNIGLLSSLKSLNLSNCCNLEALPGNIGLLSSLKSLNLSNCSNIEALPGNIELLSSLKSLNLSNCRNLKALPGNIGLLSSLKSLNLSNCSNIEALPGNIELLSSLKSLNLSNCRNLKALPGNIGLLSSLKSLNLSNCCNLEALPGNIGLLSSLKSLNLSNCCNLEALPGNIGLLSSLKSLNLSNCCNLEALPGNIGLLTPLKSLNLSNCCKLEALPGNIGLLSSLKSLNLSNCCNLEALPGNIGLLSPLKSLNLSNCCNLEALPGNIGLLSSLKSLNLSDCSNIKALPDNIALLSSLKSLNLRSCCNLEALPNNIGLLSSLESLNLSDCSNIKALPDNIGLLSSLNSLNLSNCCNLEALPDNIGFLSLLEKLNLSGSNVESLPTNVKNLSMLKELYQFTDGPYYFNNGLF